MIQKIWGVIYIIYIIYIISVSTAILAAVSPCGNKPTPANANVTEEKPNTLVITCKEGYTGSEEKETLTCLNGNWSESKINCTAVSPCGNKPTPANAKVTEEKPNILIITCKEGYTGSKENETLTCQNGNWPESKINCSAISPCGNKPTPANAKVTEEKPNTLMITCKEGYTGSKENETLTCQNGNWPESKINCTAVSPCGNKPTPANAKVTEEKPNILIITCKEGYTGSKENETLTCQNGNWPESKINCTAVSSCGNKPTPANANVTQEQPNTLIITCKEGYAGSKENETLTCQNGNWSESTINCTALGPCDKKPFVAHANLTELQLDTLMVTCLEGYAGSKENETLTCQNGTWAQSEINCTDLCTILPNITNAEVKLIKPGVAKVTCLEGYEGAVDQEISCKNGIWKKEKINCTAVQQVSENQVLKFVQYIFKTALHKNYLLCIFLNQSQTCGCVMGEMGFVKYEKKKIVSHNDERIVNATLEECSANCKSKQWCVSFEYSAENHICHLSKTAQYMLNKLLFVNKDSVDYYEKVCRSDA